MSAPRFSDPELLARQSTEEFHCGRPALDTWLIEHARASTGAGSARTYVVCDREQGDRVVGYFALNAGGVEPASVPPRVRVGMPRHPIPVVLLARLAVDVTVQGHGLGAFLLADAMGRSLAAAESIGVRALLVHAKDESARAFYERFGFVASPTDPLHLMLLMKDLRANVR
ncbi:GNAT family N-acetyltransferase [Patulibacter defluvii]|uniref:GNAT family N-acetyltransferase n=1 Tax=Patulibacter defluvii TaxID=3095358 RepID=UPI002A75ED60|nr:GNAT family N-acetyltransferase [Patulibacter sp. DM4]